MRNTSVHYYPIYLQEVQLYDTWGSQVSTAALQMNMSSQLSASTAASNCNDGITSDITRLCQSRGFDGDPSPWLAAAYPCSVELGQVVVYMRSDVRLSHIRAYALQVCVIK